MATCIMTAAKTPLIVSNSQSSNLRSNHLLISYSNQVITFPRLSLSINKKPQFPKFRVSASSSSSTASPPIVPKSNPKKPNTLLSDSITSIFAIGLSLSRIFQGVLNKAPELGGNLVNTAGPLFFAAIRERPKGYLNTPLTVVASGMSKWLDIYSGVLMVRVLLSWFPNVPWDRQPLSAIRDLCDPYLNLFRNIIPPIFDTLDVSPLLAFAVLGVLGSILNNSRGMY
ncbi:hypothetical protein C5167_007560 [Papaver somniferum]|uniref:ylmG homolog protein 1-2, chloroplastic-like n=1 Tax=Papaver somniferum TaxID=3469 RepID=UPI000E6FE267|nr:ylmG homolog protein 1-2, chloroplastic-like [Papaver somniferum]RZC92639.1 hypothetical protein C5167_007560 [Papaver somniferum]